MDGQRTMADWTFEGSATEMLDGVVECKEAEYRGGGDVGVWKRFVEVRQGK